MKKLLLGTSALVVAGFAAASAPAVAQTTQAFGSPNFAVTVGGYARQFVQYTGQTNTTANVRSDGVDQHSDNRLILTFRAAVPNGMSAGAVWQINPNANTSSGNSVTRRMWSFLEGSFGQVQLGGADNVTAQSAVGSFEAFTGGFVVGDQTVLANATNRVGVAAQSPQASNPSTGQDIDGIANKIVYYTPRIEGFQAGVNYTPEQAYRQGLPVEGTQYTNGWAGNLNYINTLGGVAVRAAAGYLTWEAPSGVGMTAVQAQATNAKPRSWNVGLGLQYQGFDIGGSYQNVKNWRNIANGTTTAAAALPTTIRTFDGNTWEAGIGYIFGAAAVSVNYTRSHNDDANITTGVAVPQNGGKDKIEVYGASGRYTLAPGVTANLGVFTAKYTEGTINAGGGTALFGTAQSSRANGVVSGLTLAF